MNELLSILKFVPVLIAAVLVGNAFLKEVQKARRQKAPWYKPYLTVPGVIVVIALLAPLVLWLIKK
ncbi:MAG: hypothetical protein PVG78_14875 [Desulfobacterales bacterium]|jgi:hypothetical protein